MFQNHGPATAKLLSPSQMFVRGTIHVSTSADHSLRWPTIFSSFIICCNGFCCLCKIKFYNATFACHSHFVCFVQIFNVMQLDFVGEVLRGDRIVNTPYNVSASIMLIICAKLRATFILFDSSS